MDIEKVASEEPDKINTTKVELKEDISDQEIENIIKPFSFDESQKIEAKKLVKALYKILIEKDASLIEINPLIVTKKKK